MSKLYENQSYSLKLKFVKASDEEHLISMNISINCNHEINKDIMLEIENNINDMLLKDYIKQEEYDKKKKQEKESEKQIKKEEQEKQRELRKLELENLKIKLEEEKQQRKLQLEYEKNLKNNSLYNPLKLKK
jgi:hypothetical protein